MSTIINNHSQTTNDDKDRVLRYSFIQSLGIDESALDDDDVLAAYAMFIEQYGNASWTTFRAPKNSRVITISGFVNRGIIETGAISVSLFVDGFLLDGDNVITTIDINSDKDIEL